MPSISQAQKKLGKDFDLGGEEKREKLDLGAVETVMYEAATKFLKLAQARIKQRRKVDRGNMSDIEVFPMVQSKGMYTIVIGYPLSNPASEYYDFQNKGVTGVKSRQPNSKYSFKTVKVSGKMINAIMAWYLRHKSYIKNEDQKKGLSGIQKKRKKLASIVSPEKKLRQLAKQTAERIKERGLPRIGFFDDFIDDAFGEKFKKDLSVALGQYAAITVKTSYNGYYNR